MKKISTLIVITTAACCAWAQNITCGGFSPSQIRPDETATYTITMEGIRGALDADSIPMPDGLQIVGVSRSQKYSITNGKASSQTDTVFTVAASREGVFTVPEWTVEYKSKKYTIKPATLKVDKSAPQQARSAASPFDDEEDAFGFPSMFRQLHNMRRAQVANMQNAQHKQAENLGRLSDNIFLKIELPKQKIYVGEALPCRLVFSYNKALAAEGFKLARLFPQANKSDAFDCALHEDKFSTNTDDGDKISVSYEILITPLKAGKYNLDFNSKGVFLQEYRVDSFFSMPFGAANQIPFETSTKDMSVQVLPLPEKDKPADFAGAIGKFTMQNAKVEPDSVARGEPCVVSVEIMGMGNFARVNAPALEKSADWKTYRPKSTFADDDNSIGYVGIKTFKYTIVPNKADLTSTPKFSFSFFDPETETYKTAVLDGASVSVAPSGKQAQPEKPAAQVEKSGPNFDGVLNAKATSGTVELFASPAFWCVQFAILAAVAAFVGWRLRVLRLRNNPMLAKRVECRKAAGKFFEKAKKAAAKNDVDGFLENAKKTLQHILAAAAPMYESGAIARAQAEEILATKGFDNAEIYAVSRLFEAADAINFGGVDKSTIDTGALSELLGKIYGELK